MQSHLYMPPKRKNGEELQLFYKYLLKPGWNKRLISLLLWPIKRAICGHKSDNYRQMETLTRRRH